MTDLQPGTDPGRSFGSVALAYDRGRPSYPVEAATWLTEVADADLGRPLRVLELGAGTGKLTEVLVSLGHDVHATDPDEAMLEVLRARLPLVRVSATGAEEIPLPDRSVDVVVAGQAFHWFDLERALPEINRVLRPGGHLGLVWNQRDDRVPWVRRLGGLIGEQDQRDDLGHPLEETGLFGWVEDARFKHRQHIDRETIQDLVLSRSHVAVLDEAGRQAKVAEVLAFYDDYGRGMDGMHLPLIARCFRTKVVERRAVEQPVTPLDAAGGTDGGRTGDTSGDASDDRATAYDASTDSPMLVTTGSIPRIEVEVAKAPPPSVIDDDTAMLLIDFR